MKITTLSRDKAKILHPHHFEVLGGESIRRSHLGNSILRYIKSTEKYLGRKCGKIWWQRNPKDEDILFARMNNGRGDYVISTLAVYVNNVGWVTTH